MDYSNTAIKDGNIRNFCPDANKGKCVKFEKLEGDNSNYRIKSKMTEGDMTVILQIICEAPADKKICDKRLSWEQLDAGV